MGGSHCHASRRMTYSVGKATTYLGSTCGYGDGP